VALANAHHAYGRYRQRFADGRWQRLSAIGARPQRPLWASTATKDPAYSDVLYVEALIAPGVINTMPEGTLGAFADHGTVGQALDPDPHDAVAVLRQAMTAGVELDTVTARLERDGVRAFCDAYRQLIDRIATKAETDIPV
jgi:transaldolase